MKPKIELGKEYQTRGGGKAIVYRDDGVGLFFYLGARTRSEDNGKWRMQAWDENGVAKDSFPFGDGLDLLLPRTVMVPVTVPEWAMSVMVSDYGQPAFSCDPADSVWISIEDWIASLEEKSDE